MACNSHISYPFSISRDHFCRQNPPYLLNVLWYSVSLLHHLLFSCKRTLTKPFSVILYWLRNWRLGISYLDYMFLSLSLFMRIWYCQSLFNPYNLMSNFTTLVLVKHSNSQISDSCLFLVLRVDHKVLLPQLIFKEKRYKSRYGYPRMSLLLLSLVWHYIRLGLYEYPLI